MGGEFLSYDEPQVGIDPMVLEFLVVSRGTLLGHFLAGLDPEKQAPICVLGSTLIGKCRGLVGSMGIGGMVRHVPEHPQGKDVFPVGGQQFGGPVFCVSRCHFKSVPQRFRGVDVQTAVEDSEGAQAGLEVDECL